MQQQNRNLNSYYFITICTHGHRQLLANAKISDLGVSKITPTQIGQAVIHSWAELSQNYPCIILDSFCLMPNHIHSIVLINNHSADIVSHHRKLRMVHNAVSSFKAETTRIYNLSSKQDYKSRLWQTSFHCEAIDSENALKTLQKYISENLLRWNEDEYF